MRTDFVLCLFMLNLALGLSGQAPARPHCIRMTPDKEKEIEIMIEKLSAFLGNLTADHEHFDISLMKLAIENHSDDEVEEKETVLQLSVNDCQLGDGEYREAGEQNNKASGAENAKQADLTANANRKPRKNVQVMYLDLQENGQEIVTALDKKAPGPRLVYVEKNNGHLNYLFNKKK